MIVRIQEGDTAGYSLIVRAYQQQIYGYCCRLLGNRQEAEDAVQEILVKAFQAIGQYKPMVNFSAWLYRIAYNYCLNLLRRQKLHRKVMRIFGSGAETTGPEQELEARIFSPPLEAALTRLSLEERNILMLRVFEEKSYAEMSEILNISANALNKRVKRIIRKVRQAIKSEEESIWEETSVMNTKI